MWSAAEDVEATKMPRKKEQHTKQETLSGKVEGILVCNVSMHDSTSV